MRLFPVVSCISRRHRQRDALDCGKSICSPIGGSTDLKHCCAVLPRGVAVTTMHAVPLIGSAGGDVQSPGVAIAPVHTVTHGSAVKGVVQSNANKLVLNNYLNVDEVGQMLLDESVKLPGVDLPQSRADDASLHRNLKLASAACGYKCPVRGCPHQVAPRAGMRSERLERDKNGHLLHLSVEPQMREALIVTH